MSRAIQIPRRLSWLVALTLSAGGAGTLSCGGSSTVITNDGGGGGAIGADAAVDLSGGGGADAPGADASLDLARERFVADIGGSCSVGADCVSGQCFDGVCCAQDCSGACHSCAIPGSVGTCLLAEVGTDPHDDCPDDGSATCGRDGTCDGSGACRKYPTGIVCKQPSCSGSTLTLAFRCAAGACAPTSGQPCDPFACGTAATCASTCTRDQDCTPPNSCNNGSCGKPPLGGHCVVTDDCNSGVCQQGVCCSTTCTGACRSCALAGSEGACTNVPDTQDPLNQCNDAGAASCGTDGSCDGAGACRFYARGTTCRAAGGICDIAETCAGAGVPCPVDVLTTGTVCRASAGLCDPAETCSGTAATCPPDALTPANTVCRPLAGMCDVAEVCSGGGPACPPDGFVMAGMTCRASAGICDVAEACTGSGPACPPDVLVGAGTPCRGSAGVCDVAEACTGSGPTCPPDVLVGAGTPCRTSAGVCDVAETCTGSAPACPPDVLVAAGTTCRASAGACDVVESCDGATAACPPDALALAGVVCHASTTACDVAEICDGALASCPVDTGVVTLAAPTGLATLPGNGQALLTWNSVLAATAYNIKRSTTSGGPYTLVGSTVNRSFINTGLTNGTTYFFVVSATLAGGGCESANSAQAAVTPGTCPGVFCDNFETDAVGTMAVGWTRVGGSAGDWTVVAQGTQFLAQTGAVSATLRAAFNNPAVTTPWTGAISVSADVELIALGISAQAALVCPRWVDTSNYYCLAVGPTGVQIQTRVGGSAANSAIFAQAITNGSIHTVRLSLSAAGLLSATLDGSVRGTFTPVALASGFAAVATVSIEAEFDNIVVTQP